MKNIIILFIVISIFTSKIFGSDNAITDEQQCLNYDSIQHREKYPYTINLMWINKDANFDQQYIFPEYNESEPGVDYISYVLSWALNNPEKTIVQVWYDSALVSEESVTNTQKKIKSFQESTDLSAPIVLRDLRSLPFVQDNIHVLSTILPVYFRTDLLRLIVLFDEVTRQGTSYAVYGDLDMPSITHEELFDEETLFILKKYGTVITGSEQYYENSFQILTHHNKYFLEALKTAIIDVFTEGARVFILNAQDAGIKSHRDLGGATINGIGNAVYSNYRTLFEYFAYLDGRGTLTIGEEVFDIQKHGLMTLMRSSGYGTSYFWHEKLYPNKGNLKLQPKQGFCTPTKDVRTHSTHHFNIVGNAPYRCK